MSLLRYTLEGDFVDTYATGLRNSAGFDEGPDGAIYISDDYGGAVYRVRYGGTNVAAGALSASPRSEGYDPGAVSDAEREAAFQVGTALLTF